MLFVACEFQLGGKKMKKRIFEQKGLDDVLGKRRPKSSAVGLNDLLAATEAEWKRPTCKRAVGRCL